MQATTGVRPRELDTPAAPPSLLYLVAAFQDVARGRQPGFAGPGAITWGEIQAWCALNQTPLEPWEVRVVRDLDCVWLDAWAEANPSTPQRPATGAARR